MGKTRVLRILGGNSSFGHFRGYRPVLVPGLCSPTKKETVIDSHYRKEPYPQSHPIILSILSGGGRL
jgi:hypothetical protein